MITDPDKIKIIYDHDRQSFLIALSVLNDVISIFIESDPEHPAIDPLVTAASILFDIALDRSIRL